MAELKSLNGLASANIKSINGLAIASVKSYNGLTIPASEWNNINTASYDNVSKNVNAQDTNPYGLFFKSDGTKMYVVGYHDDDILQYSLSTAWDLSTASYDNVNFSIASQEQNAVNLFFKSDGTKMYVMGYNYTVYQYSLSTAWDLSTASYDNVSKSAGNNSICLFFKSDGTKMYTVASSTTRVYQYSLSTAWDISTASYDSKYYNLSSQDSSPSYIFFNLNGTKMYLCGETNNTLFQYSLSTAWDISTLSYDSLSFSVKNQLTSFGGIFFKSDGTKFYIMGNSNDTVFQYSL